jgi:hypothetical protein
MGLRLAVLWYAFAIPNTQSRIAPETDFAYIFGGILGGDQFSTS